MSPKVHTQTSDDTKSTHTKKRTKIIVDVFQLLFCDAGAHVAAGHDVLQHTTVHLPHALHLFKEGKRCLQCQCRHSDIHRSKYVKNNSNTQVRDTHAEPQREKPRCMHYLSFDFISSARSGRSCSSRSSRRSGGGSCRGRSCPSARSPAFGLDFA